MNDNTDLTGFVADVLRLANTVRESPRERAHARMLRAFEAEAHPPVAPTHTDTGGCDVHVHQVETIGGAPIMLANVERLTPEQVHEVVRRVRDPETAS